MKLLTQQQIRKKYSGKFIEVYPHYFEKRSKDGLNWIPVYEVRKVSKVIKENLNLPENIFA